MVCMLCAETEILFVRVLFEMIKLILNPLLLILIDFVKDANCTELAEI